jgi:hypothetical protein
MKIAPFSILHRRRVRGEVKVRAKKSGANLRLAKDCETNTSGSRTPEEMQEARDQVTNVIVDASVDMTKRVVQAVNERGNFLGLQYLWKMAGMFPAPEGRDRPERGSLAQTLIEQLGLCEEIPESMRGEKGIVESEES